MYEKIYGLGVLCKGNPWGVRIQNEFLYGANLSSALKGKYDTLLKEAVEDFYSAYETQKTVTEAMVLEAEQRLKPMEQDAKALTVHCVAHAHIDMNWTWGYQETVVVTLDTFRTMLQLMEEFPDFTFSQSQASVYKIVEEYDPQLLAHIKQKVQEGRWEVAASTWVEPDKNMPCGEALARHILYTKQYLSKLLDVSKESIRLDFEPDTFGHSKNIPEICNAGGIQYYYYNRGFDEYQAFRWKTENGSELLVFRDPAWYNVQISYDSFNNIPLICDHLQNHHMLRVYGVGDHGGGPSRADLKRLTDMQTWPIYPNLVFSSYDKFFSAFEKESDALPVVEGELNFVFTGCYSSQSRIKRANRFSEEHMLAAETLGSVAKLCNGNFIFSENFHNAWISTLFNHFHDILPGSGVIDTREHAMGSFQNILAAANANASRAMQAIAGNINTISMGIPLQGEPYSISEGSGVGFACDERFFYRFPHTERGNGIHRVMHVYNTTQYDRDEAVELIVWDWPGNTEKLAVYNSKGEEQPFWIMERVDSWAHKGLRILTRGVVPAFGYTTLWITEKPYTAIKPWSMPKDRTDHHISDADIVLDNGIIRATFDSKTMQLISLLNLKDGTENVDTPACFFQYALENDKAGMTSWRVGPYMLTENLNEVNWVKVEGKNYNALRQEVEYCIPFRNSHLRCKISLDAGKADLQFYIFLEWHEVGRPGAGVPQLKFVVPTKYASAQYTYDVPFAVVERKPLPHDVPANTFLLTEKPAEKGAYAFMLTSDCKYGFRGTGKTAEVTLIRSSYDPDPYPEKGNSYIRLQLSCLESADTTEAIKRSCTFANAMPFVSGKIQEGTLPVDMSLLQTSSNVKVTAVKPAEEGDALIVRFFGLADGVGRLTLPYMEIAEVVCTDLNETVLPADKQCVTLTGNTISLPVVKEKVYTLQITGRES